MCILKRLHYSHFSYVFSFLIVLLTDVLLTKNLLYISACGDGHWVALVSAKDLTDSEHVFAIRKKTHAMPTYALVQIYSV